MVARTWLRATVASLVVMATLMLSTTAAEAGVSASPVPDFPTTTTVGESFTGAIIVVNNSFGVEATQPVRVQSLTLAPACMQPDSGPNCAGGIDAGVFSLGPTGTGVGVFAGISFSISQTSPGLYTFTPSAPLSLNAGEFGQIHFPVTTLRAPTVDVNPGTPGVQTHVFATAAVTSPLPGVLPFVGFGSDMVTVNRLSAFLATQASTNSTNVAPGSVVIDTATVSSPSAVAPAPTGTVTYTLVGPLPIGAACTSPVVGTSTVPVGSPSAPFTVSVPGQYNFLAAYSGDANYNSIGPVGCLDPAERFSVTRRAVADFDGNGRTDVSVYRPSTGQWGVASPPSATQWGAAGDIPAAGDYNGDGRTETAVFRPSNGAWYIGGTSPMFVLWGQAGDVPVPADYDGNGTTDVAVYRPSNGAWYLRTPTPSYVQWGVSTDIPVPGDYDGNGAAEPAIYRPSAGAWYLRTPTPSFVQWGATGDIPVPADYDGNGTTDVAVYRPVGGNWYLRTTSPALIQWGQAGDVPVPGDYDGNGTADVAVFRPGNGAWYLRTATPAFVQWGINGDVPVPLPAAIHRRFFTLGS